MTNGNNKWDRMAAEWFLLAEEIQTDVQGAVDVLDDLLNYDQIEQGTLCLELTLILISQLVKQVIDEFQLPAANKKLEFELCFNIIEDGEGKSPDLLCCVEALNVLQTTCFITFKRG